MQYLVRHGQQPPCQRGACGTGSRFTSIWSCLQSQCAEACPFIQSAHKYTRWHVKILRLRRRPNYGTRRPSFEVAPEPMRPEHSHVWPAGSSRHVGRRRRCAGRRSWCKSRCSAKQEVRFAVICNNAPRSPAESKKEAIVPI